MTSGILTLTMEREKTSNVGEVPHYLLPNQNLMDQPPFDQMESRLRSGLLAYLGDEYDRVIAEVLPTIIRAGAECIADKGTLVALRAQGLNLNKSSVTGIRDLVKPILEEYPYCIEYLKEKWGRNAQMYDTKGDRIIGKKDENGKPLYHIDSVVSYAAYAYAHIESRHINRMVGLYEILPIEATVEDRDNLAVGKKPATRRYSIKKSGYYD